MIFQWHKAGFEHYPINFKNQTIAVLDSKESQERCVFANTPEPTLNQHLQEYLLSCSPAPGTQPTLSIPPSISPPENFLKIKAPAASRCEQGFEDDENVLELDSDIGYIRLLTQENYWTGHLQMVNMVNFMFCKLYLN